MFLPHHRCTGPGGHLIVRESELIMYNDERPPPEGQEPDLAAYMQGTSIVANMNRIFTGGALQRGFVVRCALIQFLRYAKATHQATGYCLKHSSKWSKPLVCALFRLGASRFLSENTVIPAQE